MRTRHLSVESSHGNIDFKIHNLHVCYVRHS
jgi:hypothetical protein